MYLQNKYSQWYNNIIENARSRILDKNIYTEKHHIIPKSLGGLDTKENLIVLTAKEHFICHLLLTKMVVGDKKRSMYHAAWKMANQKTSCQERYKVNSHTYSLLKENNAKALSESNKGKSNDKIKGRTLNKEWREKISKSLKGHKRSQESVEKQRKSMTGKKRQFSKEWCNNISKGKQNPSLETREKLRQAKLNRTYIINNDLKKCKCVKNNELDCYLEAGWVIGRRRFNKNI